ncbi:hypothetical protein ABD76_00970 [Paenibacillus dendritiformis]|uniref:hypothetical protein n=1 Tax=Paenibacillus dendritiformis TaxID=130049 RepID=UPI0018CF4E37|nr:hypothetical protein [Paenibacillus dendritiformis]MBG9791173.1 hypothetical protein [Paenibacillus dendritiformis]
MRENVPSARYGKLITETLFMASGIVVGLFGLVMMAGYLASEEQQSSGENDFALLALLSLLPIAAGCWLCYMSWKRKRKRKLAELENAALSIAARKGGRLTAAELAMDARIDVQKARALLEHFVKEKAAILKIADNGAYVYEFDGLLDEREKADAQSLKELIYGKPL